MEEKKQIIEGQGPRFLYPTSRQFPFDEVCERIVRELEARNWRVPDIKVEFDIYGTGEAKYQMVRYIKGDNFKLWFCRIQGRLNNHWNNTAAVSELVIPRMELHVYEDESGPTFYLYVGKNWKKDHGKFINSRKVHSKLDHKSRIYLKYTGGCKKPNDSGLQHTYGGRRSPYLVHTNDLGREYDPEGKEPCYFVTDDIFTQFTKWLEENVLNHILAQPVATVEIGAFQPEKVILFPDSIGPLFTFGTWQDKERIEQGKEDPKKLEACYRYGLSGSGYRLVSYEAPNDGTMPEIAYDGFEWCGIGEVAPTTLIEELEIPGHHRWPDREQFVIRVIPNRANGIYVADISVRDNYKKKIFENNPEQERMSDKEYHEYLRTAGRTIIPISEYRGDYKKPVVLIKRELSFNEVEIVSGPHKKAR